MKDLQPILLEIESISSVVAGLPKNLPYKAPDGYFNNLSNKVLNQIKSQDIEKEELTPLLQALRKENPFSAPTDYLTQFKVTVPTITTKVVPFFRLNTVLKYAAAASVIGIIVTFATLFFNNGSKSTIAKSVDETKISSDAFELYLSEVEELHESEPETTDEDSQSLLVQMDAGLVAEILKEIPEKEISTYIDLIKNEDLNMMN